MIKKLANYPWLASKLPIILLTIFVFVVFLIYVPELSYWWDEWTILESIMDKPYLGMYTDHMGHFFPLGRLLFAVEVFIFGSHYIFLVITNFFIVVLICRQSYHLLCDAKVIERGNYGFLFAFIILYLMSESLQHTIQWGFMLQWFLSILFALFAIKEMIREKSSLALFAIFYILSWLSLSSNLPLVTILLSIFLIISDKQYKIKKSLIFAIVNASAVCLTFLGLLIAERNPPTDSKAVGIPIDIEFLLFNIFDVLKTAIVMATSWLLAPLLVVIPAGLVSFEQFASLLNDNKDVTLLLFVGLFFVASLGLRIVARSEKTQQLPILVFFGLLISSSLIAAGRFGTVFADNFNVRYGPILMLYSLIFWIGVIRAYRVTGGIQHRIMGRGFSFLMTITCVFSIFLFPQTVANSSFPGRIIDTSGWLVNLRDCRSKNQIEVPKDIQPSMSGERMCEIANKLKLVP